MNLYLSDERFMVSGQSYEGFPILVDGHGMVVEVALRFFVSYLLSDSAAMDLKTWSTYGQHLYDYFGYLEAKGLRWDYIPLSDSGDLSPTAHYRNWCNSTVGNSPGYINDKLGTVTRFYKWAHKEALIESLPYQLRAIRATRQDNGHLSHVRGTGQEVETSALSLPEPKKSLQVLTRAQVEALLTGTTNPTHRAVIHLGLSAGLRAEELASFPAHYVVDCSKLPPNVRSVRVRLNPKEMDTKNNKARTVRVSVSCMNVLWQYRATTREMLRRRSSMDETALFLTRFGVRFEADGFAKPLERIGQRLGIYVHPHMLRHTFATHTLAALEDLKRAGKLRGSPIIRLMKLLGHSSITTTSRYLHFIDEIDDEYGTKYQAEIDAIALALLDRPKTKKTL